jgi:hypothetical protein
MPLQEMLTTTKALFFFKTYFVVHLLLYFYLFMNITFVFIPAALYLLKPVVGPAELFVTLVLENRDFSGLNIITRHITYVHIYVSEYHL